MATAQKSRNKGRPLDVAPPTALAREGGRCLPTLILNLTRGLTEKLEDVLRNDLVFAETSRWSQSSSALYYLPDEVKLNIVQYADGPTLFDMTRALGGSLIVVGGCPATRFVDGIFPQAQKKLRTLGRRQYQAIVVDDESILEDEIMTFIREQYERFSVSLVVMASPSHVGPEPLGEHFGVRWATTMDHTRIFRLTERGRHILTSDAFPHNEIIATSLLVHDAEADENMFSTYFYVDPKRIIGENRNGQPIKGCSPVVARISGDKALSYFGFRYSAKIVNYGAIVLRLCYAADHDNPELAARLRALRLASQDANDSFVPTVEAKRPDGANRGSVDNEFRSRQLVEEVQSRAARDNSLRPVTRSGNRRSMPLQERESRVPAQPKSPVLTTTNMAFLLAVIALLIAIYLVPDEGDPK